MEFRDVENINKEVIVRIKDVIELKVLMHYMEQWGFSVMTIQGIQAEIKNHGETYAVMNFLDAIKRRPGSFPKFIAALRHTKQCDVYDIFMEQIGKYFSRQEGLAKVESLILEEERKLGIKHHDGGADDGNGRNQHSSSSGNLGSPQVLLAGCKDSPLVSNPSNDNQQSLDIYRRGQGQSDNHQREQPVNKKSEPVTPKVSNTKLTSSSSSSLASLDDNSPGATGNTDQSSKRVSPSSTVDDLDPDFADEPISSLKANVYKMLGKSLEKINTHGDDKEPWWNHIIDKGDLNVSRKEQRQIGKHGSPGVEFLDILDEREYTLQDLGRLFTQFNITEALDILRQHQNKVIRNSTPSRTRDNNLNMDQTSKAETNKNLNISIPVIPQTDAPPGPPIVHSSPSDQSVSRPDSCASNRSFENNNFFDSSLPSIEDPPMKGTVAIQACGDPTRTQSQPNPEEDAEKLRNDRVNQFETAPQALENTSFIDVSGSMRSDTALNQRNDDNGNVQLDEGEQERNNAIPLHVESGDISANSASQSGSSGNLPLLSGLQSISLDSSSPVQMRGESQEAPEQGIVDVPPRTFTSYEKNVDNLGTADLIHETGVNYVPPSIDSEDSKEASIEGEFTFSTRGLSGDHLNIQSITSVNDESTGSLTETDFIQETESACGGNNNIDSKPEDSKN